MKLWQSAAAKLAAGESRGTISVSDLAILLGQRALGLQQTIHGDEEPPPSDYEGFAHQLFAANPVVYGAEKIRRAVFSQARFKWRNVQTGRLFGDEALRVLEQPWRGATTKTLLNRLIIQADLGGNGYTLRLNNRLHLLRPDWVTIILGSNLEPPPDASLAEDAEVVGFMYMPRGRDVGRLYGPTEVAHFAPEPDPLAHFRGMSWLTPVVREIQGDRQSTEHKLKFFEQAATPNMIVKFDVTQTIEQVKAFKDLVENDHSGLADAYRTLYLGGGADATIVGSNLQELDFAKTQGKAETRILMAAGVHPVIAGASEGMQGASLNAGNFSQVRRIFSDIHLQDMWLEASSALQNIVQPVPAAAELTVDSRNVPFLQDDAKDEAEIQREQARAITTLVRDGFTADSAVAAIVGNDMSLLQHSGFTSVQLQPPLDNAPPEEPDDDADEPEEEDE